MTSTVDRFVRQAELVPREMLETLRVSVIGVGAVGRQLALQLSAMGARKLQLVDFDFVESTNVTTQGYWADDLGQLKVEATRAAVLAIDPIIDVQVVADRYRPALDVGEAVVLLRRFHHSPRRHLALCRFALPVLGGWADAGRNHPCSDGS